MSTEYSTDLDYDKFVNETTLKLIEPKEKIFISDSKVIYNNMNYIHVFRGKDNKLNLCRFGKNSIWGIFAGIIKQFNCVITDEYGLEYPECMD